MPRSRRVRSSVVSAEFLAGAWGIGQVAYRDPDPVFCPAPDGSTFNASQGLAIVWAP